MLQESILSPMESLKATNNLFCSSQEIQITNIWCQEVDLRLRIPLRSYFSSGCSQRVFFSRINWKKTKTLPRSKILWHENMKRWSLEVCTPCCLLSRIENEKSSIEIRGCSPRNLKRELIVSPFFKKFYWKTSRGKWTLPLSDI